MPQAPDWLRAKFPGHDAEALDVIATNYTQTKGLIMPKNPEYRWGKATPREREAILYLIHEWDYGYNENPIPEEA